MTLHAVIEAPGAGRIADLAEEATELIENGETPEYAFDARWDAIQAVMDESGTDLLQELSFPEAMVFLDDVTDHYDVGNGYETGQVHARSDWRESVRISYEWHVVGFSIYNHLDGDYERGAERATVEIEFSPMARLEEIAARVEGGLGAFVDGEDAWYGVTADVIEDELVGELSFPELMYVLDRITKAYGVEGKTDTVVRDALLADDWRDGVTEAYAVDITRGALEQRRGDTDT